MFERFYAGFTAARECWEILGQDKKLLLFPLVSGIACFVVLLSFSVPLAVMQPPASVALLGAGWSVVTYFVVAVLIVEKVGPIRAVSRSARILKETWGEALGGRIGIGWFLLPFWILGIGLFAAGLLLMHPALPVGLLLL